MDGNGDIQVNRKGKKSLQYRLIIKLSNSKYNYNMLIKIAKVIGGRVIITSKRTDVIWIVNEKREVRKIIKIYKFYPPLTSKNICQLAFLKTCLIYQSSDVVAKLQQQKYPLGQDELIETCLSNRNLKYDKQLDIINSNNFKTPNYFKEWLSGFIEAKGSFFIRKSNNHSISIGPSDDIYLMDAIRQYFEITNRSFYLTTGDQGRSPLTSEVSNKNYSSKFCYWKVFKKEVLLKIINHCIDYPLLGEKSESLKKFKKKTNLFIS